MARGGTATPLQTPPVAPQGAQTIPFRRATIERANTLPQDARTITAATQPIENTIEGAGYIYGITLDVQCVTAGNMAATTFAEDGPWSALSSVVLRDVNGELVNVGGFDLMLCNLAGAQYAVNFPTAAALSVLFSAVTGGGATGGSFTFVLRVPVGINRRDLVGIMGNQDRAQKYQLRNDVAPSASIYGVAPTNAGALTINKYYENYAVPLASGPQGQPQAQFPPSFGTFHYITGITHESVPQASATLNHYLRRIGNTIRYIILVFRSNALRATAETAMIAGAGARIQFKVGEDVLFNETYRYRKFLMFERYGFDFPAGVLVYDAMHDFASGAGDELGDDYWHTQAVNNAQFEISYPATWTNANSSLRIITDDLQVAGIGPMVG